MRIEESYRLAKEAYARLGVDTEAAIQTLLGLPISIHCWQGDDLHGFEVGAGELSGGIQATGNYPGRARTPEELMSDLDKALSLIPGKHRIALHASYAITGGERVERDEVKPEHFAPWMEWAKKRGLGLDFNPTFFSHPKSERATLSSADEEIRSFWVRHGVACRRIAEYFGRELGTYSICNVWIPDGSKDIPADRLSPRLRLKKSLDEVFAEKLPHVIDTVESKVFGIGLESYTVGSNEFYLSYAATHPGVYDLLDIGHFHPTEVCSDKLAAMLPYFDKIPLHVTRSVRWDSDHVVLLEEEVKEIAKEIIRNDAMDKILVGLDFFDASINRVAAWVIGTRDMQKALLSALLTPHDTMKALEREERFTELMMLGEELKTYPLGAVWDEICRRQGTGVRETWYDAIREYEREILSKRG